MSSYILVVGFHHKKGTSLEYIYPELPTGLDLPPAWSYIPSTALPDGAHNFDRDYVFFTVPSLEDSPTTLFGIACYRQVDVKDFTNRLPDLTRNTVQMSIIYLSTAPLFGLISSQLDDIADAFIAAPSNEEGYAILRRGFGGIQDTLDTALRSPSYESDLLLRGLSAVQLVRAYQREALVLLKLLLLERRVLFACETAVHCMSTWLLTLVSLIPGILHGGLSRCAIVDETWIGERACWPLAVLSTQSMGHTATPLASDAGSTAPPQTGNGSSAQSTEGSASNQTNPANASTTPPPADVTPDNSGTSRVGAFRAGATSIWSNVTKTASAISARVSAAVETSSANEGSTFTMTTSSTSSSQQQQGEGGGVATDAYSALPPLTDGSVFDSPLPTDDWGLPLSLFCRSYLFLPYIPLHCLDSLLEHPSPPPPPPNSSPSSMEALASAGRRVRGFLGGTTNPLLTSNTRLADVIVTTLPFPPAESRTPSGEVTVEAVVDQEDEVVENASRQDPHSMSSRTGGVFSRFMNRQLAVIRICPSSNDPRSKLRDLPVPLSRALQLSRLDRIFIDHLVNTAELWFAAKAASEGGSVGGNATAAASATDTSTTVQGEIVEEKSPRELAEAEVLVRFPELNDLEQWVRAQFTVYIKSLLLTSEGRGGTLGDFNLNYVACLRSTHAFLAWRSQVVLPAVMKSVLANEERRKKQQQQQQSHQTLETVVPASERLEVPARPLSDLVVTDSSEDGLSEERDGVEKSATSAYVVASPLAHPGKHFPSSEPADQIVNNLRQFGNIAADHGRRMVNQWMSGLIKLGTSNRRTAKREEQ